MHAGSSTSTLHDVYILIACGELDKLAMFVLLWHVSTFANAMCGRFSLICFKMLQLFCHCVRFVNDYKL
jgi:hypothetical protein